MQSLVMRAFANLVSSRRSPPHEKALKALFGGVGEALCNISSCSTCLCDNQATSRCKDPSVAAHSCNQPAQPPDGLLAPLATSPIFPLRTAPCSCGCQPVIHSLTHASRSPCSSLSRQQLPYDNARAVHADSSVWPDRQRTCIHVNSKHRQPHNTKASMFCPAASHVQQRSAWPSPVSGWHRHLSSSSSPVMYAAAGGSTDAPSPAAAQTEAAQQPQVLAKIEPRLAMVYTCVKCETRSVKTFSRRSYEKGLVLVRCPGCNKLHLVADHLGWFGDKGWTIQDLEAEKGIRVKVVQAPADLSASTSSELDSSTTGLSLEDWVGWSRVEQLLQEVHQQEKDTGDATSTGAQANARGQSSSASDVLGSSAQQLPISDAQGVVEVGPSDLERWRKVRDTAE